MEGTGGKKPDSTYIQETLQDHFLQTIPAQDITTFSLWPPAPIPRKKVGAEGPGEVLSQAWKGISGRISVDCEGGEAHRPPTTL